MYKSLARLRYAGLAVFLLVVWFMMFGIYKPSDETLRLVAERVRQSLLTFNETRRRESMRCQTSTAQSLFVVDSDGYLCERFSVSAVSGCCLPNKTRLAMPCTGCKPFDDRPGQRCCQIYEYCVACCMRTEAGLRKCTEDCRTNGSSLNEQEQYAHPEHRFCTADPLPTRRRLNRAGLRLGLNDERDDSGGGGTSRPIIY